MGTKKKTRPTLKQEKYAALLAKGVPQSEAFAQVYDTKNSTKASVIQMASRVARNVNVVSTIEQIKRPGLKILEAAEEDAARKLAQLVTEDEEIISTDGSLIGTKRNTEMNRKAANDVLEKLGYNGGEPKSNNNNTTIIIVPREAVEEALRRLSKSSL